MSIVLLITGCGKNGPSADHPVSGTNGTPDSGEPTAKSISFSGYTWQIKNSTTTIGPGPNYWNQDQVWVDDNGWLHLKLSKNPSTNRWECAEVVSTETFGYGTYQWQIDGSLHALDKNVVLGLFNYSGVDGLDEIDIEFARWGEQTGDPLNFTVYPPATGLSTFHKTTDYAMDGTYSTHQYKRSSNSVIFKSFSGFDGDDSNLIATETCAAPFSVSAIAMPAYINLWLFRGVTPSDGKATEIIIRSFKFTP